MKSFMVAAVVGSALAGCGTAAGDMFVAQDRTVEYVRVFDIKTDAAAPAVMRAASDGISHNISNATLTTPPIDATQLQDQPGRFKLTEAPGTARGPNCEGASWTANARPDVRGSQDMQLVACLYPYKSGYHLDMYAAFSKKEGGWLAWPRRATGMVMGTPEKYVEKTMLDIVRTIRQTTNAQVALVEAKPDVAGAPWLDPVGTAPRASEMAKP
ncbi:hypothetical protein [Massilia sp. GCM10023247]|uniref:hypothetical protein n=1 Tax=Massilia sp. GCM10023247 TaxID=3252643 RepID=UPI00361F3E23